MKRTMGILLSSALAAGIAVATFLEPHNTPSPAPTAAPALVYVKQGAKKYHNQECRDLAHARAAEILSMSREDADAAGYVACHNPKCFPR